MSFLSQMATMAGGATIANTEQQQRQANVEATQTNTAYMKMQSAMMQRKMQQEQDMAKAAAYVLKDVADSASEPMKKVQAYEKLEQTMLQKGNMSGAEEARKAANEARLAAKASQTMAAEQLAQKKETAATAATTFMSMPTQDNAQAVIDAAIQAGVKPESIPQPGSAAFVGWAQTQRKAALTAKEALEFEQKVKDEDERRAETVRQHKEKREDTLRAEQNTLRVREDGLEIRRMLAASLIQSREAAASGEKLTPKAKDTRDVVNQMGGELVASLTSLSKFAATQTQGLFPDLKSPTALEALVKAGGNVVTPEITQMHQSASTGLARTVLTAEFVGTGRAPTQADKDEMKRLLAGVAGDTPFSMAYKDAIAARIVARRMERMPKNPDPHLQALADADLAELKKFPDPDAILEAAAKSTPAARASIRKAKKSMAEFLGDIHEGKRGEEEPEKRAGTTPQGIPAGWSVTVKP